MRDVELHELVPLWLEADDHGFAAGRVDARVSLVVDDQAERLLAAEEPPGRRRFRHGELVVKRHARLRPREPEPIESLERLSERGPIGAHALALSLLELDERGRVERYDRE